MVRERPAAGAGADTVGTCVWCGKAFIGPPGRDWCDNCGDVNSRDDALRRKRTVTNVVIAGRGGSKMVKGRCLYCRAEIWSMSKQSYCCHKHRLLHEKPRVGMGDLLNVVPLLSMPAMRGPALGETAAKPDMTEPAPKREPATTKAAIPPADEREEAMKKRKAKRGVRQTSRASVKIGDAREAAPTAPAPAPPSDPRPERANPPNAVEARSSYPAPDANRVIKRVWRVCSACGKEFETADTARAKMFTMCRDCYAAAWGVSARTYPAVYRCVSCGGEFSSVKTNHTACSKACRAFAQRKQRTADRKRKAAEARPARKPGRPPKAVAGVKPHIGFADGLLIPHSEIIAMARGSAASISDIVLAELTRLDAEGEYGVVIRKIG
jgi:hypothetical protein